MTGVTMPTENRMRKNKEERWRRKTTTVNGDSYYIKQGDNKDGRKKTNDTKRRKRTKLQ